MDLEKQKQMPVWGPYSKKYMGLSRVMKESAIPGARFDLVIYPTYANSSVPAPNVTVPSNYHPWQADPEGRYFQYRYELIWKDQLYADVAIFRPGFTCLAVLWILRSCQNFYLRDSHTLRLAFPCHSVNSSSLKSSPYPERISPLGLPSSAFARHYLRNLV